MNLKSRQAARASHRSPSVGSFLFDILVRSGFLFAFGVLSATDPVTRSIGCPRFARRAPD
jgi:hypothetical protein